MLLGQLVLFASFSSASGAEPISLFNPRAFGATGDGKTVDTAAFNKAIDATHAAGGGTVFVSAGTYVCGSIHLQSNIALHVDQGATIVASANPGCTLHLAAAGIDVRHPVELLESAIDG